MNSELYTYKLDFLLWYQGQVKHKRKIYKLKKDIDEYIKTLSVGANL